jgi:hypothetical protein
MKDTELIKRNLYTKPLLDQHADYVLMTGLTARFDFLEPIDPLLKNNDFLGAEQ